MRPILTFVGGEIVERAIIGFRIDPPEPGTADVGDARAELVAEQPKNAEDHVCICAGIGHDFSRLKHCLLFEHNAQQHEAIAQSAGDGDGVEAGKRVGDQIVIGDAAFGSKIFRVGSGMDCSNRHGEAKAIRRCDIASTPTAGEIGAILCCDETGIRLVNVSSRI
jgi:hypothetical protein